MNGYIQSLLQPDPVDAVRPPQQSRFAEPKTFGVLDSEVEISSPTALNVNIDTGEPVEVQARSLVVNEPIEAATPVSGPVIEDNALRVEGPFKSPTEEDKVVQVDASLEQPARAHRQTTSHSKQRLESSPESRQILIASSLAPPVNVMPQIEKAAPPKAASVTPAATQNESPPNAENALRPPASYQERSSDITISIGRVIVTGAREEQASSPPRSKPRGVMSLDEYLGRRSEESS